MRSSIYYFYGYKYYIKLKDSDSQTNLKLEKDRIKLLKYIEKLEKENKDYDYNEDKEKLYFKLFREWYAINLNNIGRDMGQVLNARSSFGPYMWSLDTSAIYQAGNRINRNRFIVFDF